MFTCVSMCKSECVSVHIKPMQVIITELVFLVGGFCC